MRNFLIKLSLLLSLLFMIFIICYCDKNPAGESKTDNNKKYWSVPQEDSFALFFYLFEDYLKVDSLIAGRIQYSLDLARTVDNELDSIFARNQWEFGAMLLGVTEEYFYSFDEVSCLFNKQPLDSLLNYYSVLSGNTLSGASWGLYVIRLNFNIYYNMSLLCDKFEGVKGVRYANTNLYGYIGWGPGSDILLEIADRCYKFTFYKINVPNNNIHYWEVHVLNDQVQLIAEWDRQLY